MGRWQGSVEIKVSLRGRQRAAPVGQARANRIDNDQGFVLLDEAKAFFTAVENFAQVQDRESSPQCAFDLSVTRFPAAAGGKLVGVNASGGPTA